jgi:hypothetical protein
MIQNSYHHSCLLSLFIAGCTSSGHPPPRVQASAAVGALVWISPGGPVHRCTATLISPDVIATAAHCVQPGEKQLGVAFGCHAEKPELLVRLAKIERHPLFRPPTRDGIQAVHDLALGRLEHPVDIPPLALPSVAWRQPSSEARAIKVIAFGQTVRRAYGHKHSVDGSVAQQAVSELIIRGRAQSAICRGDSGGAVVAVGATPTLIGVISRVATTSARKKTCSVVAIATRVAAHRAFFIGLSPGDR